jgi:predicted nucleic acid-binding protein
MGPRTLIDTNIVIDLLRDLPQATHELRKHRDRAISIVTWMEVMVGLRPQEQHLIDLFEQTFPVIQLTPAIAEETVRVRQELRLKLPDAVVLATAHVEKRVLLTRNTRDFSAGRFVRIPYEI